MVATRGIAENILTQVSQLTRAIVNEVQKSYIGDAQAVEALLTALLARGHVLIEGVPGIAKTTLVKAFAQTIGCGFRRIQFTPDLLPSDITGTYILDMRENRFVLRAGPIFSHIVLGDEINRAPAKTQSALLEAMQEAQVTIEGETHTLSQPFMVLATQNPIEHEGTYPLPEAQVDRFLIKVNMRYPEPRDELTMLSTYNQRLPVPGVMVGPEDLLRLQTLADDVHVAPEIFEYIVALCQHTRSHRRVYLGASPRAGLALLRAAKAMALMRGRGFVLPDDVKAMAAMVLSHRVLLAPEAELEGFQAAALIADALDRVPYRAP